MTTTTTDPVVAAATNRRCPAGWTRRDVDGAPMWVRSDGARIREVRPRGMAVFNLLMPGKPEHAFEQHPTLDAAAMAAGAEWTAAAQPISAPAGGLTEADTKGGAAMPNSPAPAPAEATTTKASGTTKKAPAAKTPKPTFTDADMEAMCVAAIKAGAKSPSAMIDHARANGKGPNWPAFRDIAKRVLADQAPKDTPAAAPTGAAKPAPATSTPTMANPVGGTKGKGPLARATANPIPKKGAAAKKAPASKKATAARKAS